MTAPAVQLDPLSQAARELLRLNPASSYTAIRVGNSGYMPARATLEKLSDQGVFALPVSRADDARAVRAAMWLWHDWLDPAHQIVQSLDTPTGAFWHAIIHRREGDFGNSKYWYARCADHPILPALTVAASEAVSTFPADTRVLKIVHNGFHAPAFVDLVSQVNDRPEDPRHALAVSLQQLEWRVLFDHCVRGAVGGRP